MSGVTFSLELLVAAHNALLVHWDGYSSTGPCYLRLNSSVDGSEICRFDLGIPCGAVDPVTGTVYMSVVSVSRTGEGGTCGSMVLYNGVGEAKCTIPCTLDVSSEIGSCLLNTNDAVSGTLAICEGLSFIGVSS